MANAMTDGAFCPSWCWSFKTAVVGQRGEGGICRERAHMMRRVEEGEQGSEQPPTRQGTHWMPAR